MGQQGRYIIGQYYYPTLINEKNEVINWIYSHDFKHHEKRDDGRIITYGTGLKLMEHSWRDVSLCNFIVKHLFKAPKRLVWAGDYADPEPGSDANIHDMCEDSLKLKAKSYKVKSIRFILNHTKKEFVDLNGLPIADGWQIHALPLLTCEGNGRGGGDYHGKEDYIGVWARDLLESCKYLKDIPTGYKEIQPGFVEEWQQAKTKETESQLRPDMVIGG